MMSEEQARPDKTDYRKRNGLLESLLLIQVLASVARIASFFNDLADSRAMYTQYGVTLSPGWASYAWVLIFGLAIVCAIGLWYWKAWAYKSLIAVYIVGFILGLIKVDILYPAGFFAAAV